jgi:hypothetical protein
MHSRVMAVDRGKCNLHVGGKFLQSAVTCLPVHPCVRLSVRSCILSVHQCIPYVCMAACPPEFPSDSPVSYCHADPIDPAACKGWVCLLSPRHWLRSTW